MLKLNLNQLASAADETAKQAERRLQNDVELAEADLGFARDVAAALNEPVRRSTVRLVITIAFLLVAFLIWASFAEVEEVTRGDGRVIPSSRTQVIQSLEGGIVEEILVREGETVTQGDILVRIDDTGFSASLGELRARERSLRVQIARLRLEVALEDTNAEIAFPEDLYEISPELVENESRLFYARQEALRNQTSILDERRRQRELELEEARSRLASAEASLAIAVEELELKQPLADRGIIPQTDVLALQREVSSLRGEIDATNSMIPRLEAAIREAQREIDDQRLLFRQNAQAELNTALAELTVVEETLRGAEDRVNRTELRAPVDGIINTLHVTTIGGVIQPGQEIISLVPIEESLFVEARIRPQDIAFIHLDQTATVKLSAYDFAVYGGLSGLVDNISPDTVYDEASRETYYTVNIKTEQNTLRKGSEELPILPGMVATVDILTGQKSVLDYLLKPINRAREEALRER